jgi:mannose-6-phosphate isomerase-like protein (cupin superfamily)
VSVHIVNLRQVGRFDASAVLDGPIRDVRLLQLSPGEHLYVRADGFEYATFTVSGGGTATNGDAEIPLTAGVAVTVPHAGELSIRAAEDEALELFVACLAVRDEVTA